MADNKKYYYLKLKEGFFDSPEIKVLESEPNGFKYSNLLLKLYLMSLRGNGRLMLNSVIPYKPEMIASIARMDIDTVKSALMKLQQLGLIEILDNGTIYMLEIQNFIGKSSTEADRKRTFRAEIENQKALVAGQMSDKCQTNVGQNSDKSTPEIEIEIEREIEPPIVPHGDENPNPRSSFKTRFETFWKAYPRKAGKGAAEKAFLKCKPDDALLDKMLSAIESQKSAEQWKRDGGQYIPYPATWLNQKRWEDETEPENLNSDLYCDPMYKEFEDSGIFDTFER